MREKIEKILSPAINVNAPYAKHMVDAILSLFSDAIRISDHKYVVSVSPSAVVVEHGDIATTFTADQARTLAQLLNEGADILDGQTKLN
jgi:hypothetical protein